MKKLEFSQIASLRKERFNPTENGENLKCIELEHIEQNTGRILGYIDSKVQKSTKNVFYKGDILFAKLRPYLKKYWLAEFDGVCSSEIWVLKPNKQKIVREFLFNFVQTERFIKEANVTSGTKMPRADWNHIVNCSFLIINSLPEQKAIADCLTTWDRGIEKLSALIKAKKEQKKGLMQQLLTGEKRLDGFEEEWREITLGDIGVFKTSSVNKKIEENETKVWLLNYMDVYRNTHISSKIKFQLTSAKQSQISSTNLKVGDVLFTPSSETPDDIGHSAVVIENLENVVYSYHLVRFRVKKNILDINFSGYVFNKSEILNEFSRRATGSTRYTLSVKDFNEVTTFLPPLKEQSKIAEVLTTADKEITLLEKKFERFKEQKRGLMQVLLTGERRLIN